jgi:excisionase family DNA binding protein
VQVVPVTHPSGASSERSGHSMNRSELAELPPTITVMQLGKLLSLSRSAAYRLVEAGHVEAFKLGDRWFVPTAPLKRKFGL